MRSIKRILTIFMTIVMLLLMIPMVGVEASDDDVNYDTGDAGGNTGTGSTEWAFSLRGRGVRIGIYFVEGGEENFAHGIRPEGSTEPDDPEKPYVRRVGLPTDFSKEVLENMQRKYGTKYDYTVEYYTGMSVFDYMNKDGSIYKPNRANDYPYKYVKPPEPIISSMPEPFSCTKDDWVEWFTGNDYENIPKISQLCGEMISQEDFKNGIYKEPVNNIEVKGTYKIFFEPLLSARVNDVGMFISV